MFVDKSTIFMTQSFHTRSCFHRFCFIHVCCKIHHIWVDRGHVLWILVPFLWPKVFILGLVFTAFVSCMYAVKFVIFGSTGAMFCEFKYRLWPKIFILGLVFTAYVPKTYAVKFVDFESTGAMFFGLCTVFMTQSRSFFHRCCFVHVKCKIRDIWVDRGHVLWILVPFPWPKVFILGLVFTAYVPCTYAVKFINFGSRGAMFCG